MKEGQAADVINAGVAGYNSLQLRRMLSEIWALEPDVLVLYTGHNDYVFYPVIEQLLNDHPSYHRIRKGGRRFALWRGLKALLLQFQWIEPPPLPSPSESPSFQRCESSIEPNLTSKNATVDALNNSKLSKSVPRDHPSVHSGQHQGHCRRSTKRLCFHIAPVSD